jgi:hypothetical protein
MAWSSLFRRKWNAWPFEGLPVFNIPEHRAGASLLLNHVSVLVAEDQPFIALDLALAVEDAGGKVVGPAASCEEALALLATGIVGAAILDVNLVDGAVRP